MLHSLVLPTQLIVVEETDLILVVIEEAIAMEGEVEFL